MTSKKTGNTKGSRQIEFSLRHEKRLSRRQPFWSRNKISQAADITNATERRSVSLSGSNTLEEWMLKKSGVRTTAANQPASIIPSHQREILDSIRLSLPSLNRQAVLFIKNLTLVIYCG
jgi:hypothetical protein